MTQSNMDLNTERELLKSVDYIRHILLDFKQMKDFVEDPFIITRAEGVHYEDINGKIYLDGLSGIFVATAGHNNRRIVGAIKAQLDQLTFAPPLHGTNPPAIKLGKLLSEITPGTLNTFKILSGGSEATEVAIKAARQYHRQTGNPGKFKVIARYQGYHGATMGALSATGLGRRKSLFEPLLAGFIHIHPPHCYRCPFGKTYPDCAITCVTIIEDVIRAEDPSSVSAVIMEPIMNTGGIITPPDEYFPIVREICDRYEVLLIFDEIITGFGRTGNMFAAQTFDTIPDLLCMGKGMSSGYAPLAATAMSDKVASAFWGPAEAGVEFSHGHTYAGNPVSCAAGLACIQEIIERNLPEKARRMGAYLRKKLQELESFGIVGEIRGRGLLLGVELVKNPETKEQFAEDLKIGLRIGAAALRNGLIIRYDPNWFALAPPLIVAEKDIDEMMDILYKSVEEALVEAR